MRACGVCTWEQRVYAGVDQKFYPLLGGHETSGVVVEIGDGVVGHFELGDHVAVSTLFRCGRCHSCRRGLDNLCDCWALQESPEGEALGPAGFGEYIRVPDHQVFRVAKTISFQEAALSEPLACVIRSMKRADVRPGDMVAIIGCGVMGLLHLFLARGRNAITIVSEPDEARAAKAEEFGADFCIQPQRKDYVEQVMKLTLGCGVDKTFVAVSSAAVIHDALKTTAKGGSVHLYSSIHPRGSEISLDPNLFHDREVTITGTVSQSSEDFLQATTMISSGNIDLKPLISAEYPLDQLKEALEAALSLSNYRVLVMM
ncbi:MAG: alcohol dehydrogenase catalytic domain-containing protein [Candidatus Competibacteraceae bacterium]|nr:alcohol dehydrogenase catalytic domain-containing protein [Candidatus Competibacteraceae bacterium]